MRELRNGRRIDEGDIDPETTIVISHNVPQEDLPDHEEGLCQVLNQLDSEDRLPRKAKWVFIRRDPALPTDKFEISYKQSLIYSVYFDFYEMENDLLN